MAFLDTFVGDIGSLTSSLVGKLLARSFASSVLAGGLLCACHYCSLDLDLFFILTGSLLRQKPEV